MQQRKFHYLDAIAPDPRRRPALRLADGKDTAVRSAVLKLQDDLARTFGPAKADVARRPTVLVRGLATLSVLGLAAGAVISRLVL